MSHALTVMGATATFASVEREQNSFSQLANAPAVQELLRRVEPGGALSLDGVHPAAHPFIVALLRRQFPQRAIVVVTGGVKAQETFQQDLTTWLGALNAADATTFAAAPSFFPAWDILPHE